MLCWLGLDGIRANPNEESTADLWAPPQVLPSRRARTELLQCIGTFLLDNDLEITASNLALAHGACAGLNPGLGRMIELRRQSGGSITQEWLDRATASENEHSEKAAERLMQKLETNIVDFSRSTRTARSATRDYGDALEQHMDQLRAMSGAGEIISELAGYARSMLDRSRKAEAELRQSEEEAAVLRSSLESARRDADIDFLTGLPNRRAFESVLEAEIQSAQAAGEPLCIAFCDIDNFKQINDAHGHEAGDRVICVVARTLAEISSDRCHIARHGGEEFVLLFRGNGLQEAHGRLDAARVKLAARKLVNRRTGQPFGQVTFSGGLADIFAFPDQREALAAADEALYRAKLGGRNRVELALPPA